MGSIVVVRDGVPRTICGTRLYAAPEIYLKAAQITGPWWTYGQQASFCSFCSAFHVLPISNQLLRTVWVQKWSTTLIKRIDDSDEQNDLASRNI